MEHLHEAGGVPAVLRELLPLLPPRRAHGERSRRWGEAIEASELEPGNNR